VRAAHPAIAADGDAFIAWLEARGRASEDAHVEDLFVAFGCISHDREAIAALERELVQVPAWVGSIDSSSSFADEIAQTLRTKLLVGDAPKIASYEGRGALGAWLRLVAVRAARDLVRARKPEAALDDRMKAPAEDPELAFLKTHYAGVFREALESTVRGLDAETRAILKLHFLDGVKSADIGALYRVDGSTIRRRVAQAREDILKDTRKRLATSLKLDAEEVDSVLALIESRLEASISRFLRTV